MKPQNPVVEEDLGRLSQGRNKSRARPKERSGESEKVA